MKSFKIWAWLIVFGSLWGIMEVIGGESFFKNNVPFASVWLTAWALFLLGAGRSIVNKPGTSTIIGATASLFKLAYAAPYFCHLLGIFFIGLVFDLAATAWMKKPKRFSPGTLLTGVVASYGGYALFAVVITYVARYAPWVAGGTPKVLQHIFVSGSLAALTSFLMVPLGLAVGTSGEAAAARRPRWAAAGALVALAALWTLGRLIS